MKVAYWTEGPPCTQFSLSVLIIFFHWYRVEKVRVGKKEQSFVCLGSLFLCSQGGDTFWTIVWKQSVHYGSPST